MASKSTSSSSRSRTADSTSAEASSADTTGVQQAFDQWLNAWRSVADPAQWSKFTQQTNTASDAAAAPFAAFADFAKGFSNGFPSTAFPAAFPTPGAMPQMPDFTKMNGLAEFAKLASSMPGFGAAMQGLPTLPKIPTAAIAPERLHELQSNYSRDAAESAQAGGRAKHRSERAEGPALYRYLLANHARLRVHRRVVFAERALSAGTRGCGAERSEDARAHPLRRAAMGRRRRAEQFPRAQSRCAEDAHRKQGRKPAPGHDESAERHAARQDFAVGRIALSRRQEHRVDGRLGRVRERTRATDPVQAARAEGVCARRF